MEKSLCRGKELLVEAEWTGIQKQMMRQLSGMRRFWPFLWSYGLFLGLLGLFLVFWALIGSFGLFFGLLGLFLVLWAFLGSFRTLFGLLGFNCVFGALIGLLGL